MQTGIRILGDSQFNHKKLNLHFEINITVSAWATSVLIFLFWISLEEVVCVWLYYCKCMFSWKSMYMFECNVALLSVWNHLSLVDKRYKRVWVYTKQVLLNEFWPLLPLAIETTDHIPSDLLLWKPYMWIPVFCIHSPSHSRETWTCSTLPCIRVGAGPIARMAVYLVEAKSGC